MRIITTVMTVVLACPSLASACDACLGSSHSQMHVPEAGEALAVPVWESRSGAADTIHLNFGGTSEPFTRHGRSIGPLAPYGGTIAQAKDVWATVAEKFAPFSINVTSAPYGRDRDAAWRNAAEVTVAGWVLWRRPTREGQT